MSGSNPRDHNDSPSLGNGDHSSRSNRNDTDLKNGEDGNGDHVNEKKKSDEERYSDEKKHRKKEKKSKDRGRDRSPRSHDRKKRTRSHPSRSRSPRSRSRSDSRQQRKRREVDVDHHRDRRSSSRSHRKGRDERRRSSSRDRSVDRRRRDDRSRDNSRDRSHDRPRDRGGRDHSPHSRHDNRNRRHLEYAKARDRERENNRLAAEEEKKREELEGPKVTLKEILATNPGISVTEALQRLHQINAANALGLGTGVLPKMANPQALNQATKLMREIYIGNMPPGTTVPQLTDFINSTMTQMKLAIPSPFGGPVVSVWISTDSHYAFVELRTVEEASAALNHLGVVPFGGYHLRVGRPKTNSTTQAMNMIGSLPLGVGSLLSVSGTTPVAPIGATPATNDAKDVIMVSNLPDSILESQVRELLEPFGEIKTFNFIKVQAPGQAGAAVLEYLDGKATESAVKGLQGLMVGGYQLSVQRVPAHMATLLLLPATSSQALDPLLLAPPSCILRLSNMVTEEDLRDDEAYEELKEDVNDECNNYGTVRAIVIPRPSGSSVDDEEKSVGNIFVSFTSPEAATKAKNALSGRTYDGKSVVAVFYPEKLFEQKIYSLPSDFSFDQLEVEAYHDVE